MPIAQSAIARKDGMVLIAATVNVPSIARSMGNVTHKQVFVFAHEATLGTLALVRSVLVIATAMGNAILTLANANVLKITVIQAASQRFARMTALGTAFVTRASANVDPDLKGWTVHRKSVH